MNVFSCFLVVLLMALPTRHAAAQGDSGSQAASAADTLAAVDLDAPLPIAPDVRIDTLANGLTYYIRRNAEPEDRAELRLAVNAGSVLEDEDQQGLAHFLEHLLFNGTRRFEEQELVNFLERLGMRFGPDVNAYTSFDETVYMLTIPTDTAGIVDTSFQVLEDWAAYATLDSTEIEKERGVVLEEWRLSDQTASGRLREQTLPVLLHDSRYAERLPIGDTTVIRNASYEQFRRFYETWYRPDLMALVAVGDFAPDSIEARIRARFAGLSTPEDPAPRPTYEVPGHEETLYAIATDPELPVSTVQVNYKREAEPVRTVGDYREYLVGRLFNNLLNARFAEITREASAPFLSAQAYRARFARPSEFYGLAARVADDSVRTGLEALLTEAERVRQHGFTETELARQKQETLRAYRQALAERENTPSSAYAQAYVSHFLEGEPIPGIENAYELAQQLLPAIDVQAVNQTADELIGEENRVVLVQMPEKPGLTPPTEEDLAAILDRVEDQDVAPYVDETSDAPLLAETPEPAAVVQRDSIPELGVTEITLANGVRLVLKPTDFKQDQVQFTAFSPGGTSLVSDADFFDAEIASQLVEQSGVGAFDRTALQKKLAGQVVSVSPYIGELEEGLRGSASPEDLETLFQLIYLYVTDPRADSTALRTLQNQYRSYLVNRSATPEAAFQDSIRAALYGDALRRQAPTPTMVDTLSLHDAFAAYQARFADADDFTFVFTGNFDPDSLTNLAQTYLGSLPATDRRETWRDVVPDPPQRVVEKTAQQGQGNRSQVALVFHGPFDFTQQNRQRLSALENVLRIQLREELREARGGVYGVGVQASSQARPDSSYQLTVSFSTDPERVDELVRAVFEEIEALKTEAGIEDEVAKTKEQQRRQRQTALETNDFWLSTLKFYYAHEGEPIADLLRYDRHIESLDVEAVRQAARRYLDTDRYAQVVLYPEDFKAPSRSAGE